MFQESRLTSAFETGFVRMQILSNSSFTVYGDSLCSLISLNHEKRTHNDEKQTTSRNSEARSFVDFQFLKIVFAGTPMRFGKCVCPVVETSVVFRISLGVFLILLALSSRYRHGGTGVLSLALAVQSTLLTGLRLHDTQMCP